MSDKIRGQTVHSHQERLNRLSKINKKTGCVEWIGSTRNGYGRLTIGSRTDGTRKTVTAHRLSYEINIGDIPDGMFVCHKCDNPKCINPSHLFAGSRQDNVNDREKKGRNNLSGIHKSGEGHSRSKLTWDDVARIRGMSGLSQQHIADLFGVSRSTIKDILHGKTWIPQPPTEKD